MKTDPFADYRRSSVSSRETPVDPTQYAAFGTKGRLPRLRIRSSKAPVNAPGYNILLNVVYDELEGTHCILVYSILTVLVKGKNLQQMVLAIENEAADFIQEFDSGRWTKPTDAAAPFIESIEIQVMANGAANLEAKH